MIKRLVQTITEIIIIGGIFLGLVGLLIWKLLIEPNLLLILVLVVAVALITLAVIVIVLLLLLILSLSKAKAGNKTSIYN